MDALNRVPLDDALDALRHPRRREMLFALLDSGRQDRSSMGLVAFDEATGSGGRHQETDADHLSKLADFGFVDWDRETHRVGRGSKFDDVRPLLELLVDHADELPENWL